LADAALRSNEKHKRQFLLVSPSKAEKPIDGHALSVAMARFGDALVSNQAKTTLTKVESIAATTWQSERPTAHDLRRTLATRLAASGVPAEDVSACLNHSRKGVTAMHYDHYDRAKEKRLALGKWSQQVAMIVNGC
jgi:integrase